MDWTVYWFMLPVCVVVASVAMFSGISGAAVLTPVFLIGFPLLGVPRLTTVEAIGTSLLLETSGFGTGVARYLAMRLADLKIVLHADPADRPTDAAYDRFVYLVVTYRDAGYDDARLLERSPFLIQGPLFNAIWRWSAEALAEIARLVGDDPAPHRADAERIHRAMLRELWDPPGRRFGTRDVRAGRRTPEDTILAFVPLLDPGLPGPMVAAIGELLRSPCFHPAEAVEHYLVPTYDLRAPGFDPRRYWRGPVWINTDWLLWLGLRQHGVVDLAAELRASMLWLVRKSGFREYFHPFGGQGYGAGGFAWTAALVIDVLHRDRLRLDQPTTTRR